MLSVLIRSIGVLTYLQAAQCARTPHIDLHSRVADVDRGKQIN